tara:strand:- start:14 stop:625 length:612 start_codon:yes stop_codon:yes gene_type:complete
MHIAIAGNIGSGKTTLTKKLAKYYKFSTQLEEVEDNPYLNNFYKDMQRWSFNLQIFFLNSRFKQVNEISKNNKNVIQDRTIYEDAYIFAPNLHAMGLMTTKDYENYIDIFTTLKEFIQPPDLLIYLRSSVSHLVEQIQYRGRNYEDSIQVGYLNRLNERYEAWISKYNEGKMIQIDVDNLNFEKNKVDFNKIITIINPLIKSK